MHPYFQELLAKQRREELLREAAIMHQVRSEDHPSLLANKRAMLWFLLAGSALPTGKQSGLELLPHQAAALRMIGIIALVLGTLAGSLLGSEFGLVPVLLVDGTVALVLTGMVVLRSIGLLRLRAVRHWH